MELLTNLPFGDAEAIYHFTKELKARHPQINERSSIHYVKTDYVEIKTVDLCLIEEHLKPHHEYLREDIKEEIRKNLGQIINDKNFLMKIADKYYQDKLDIFTTRWEPLEFIGYRTFNSEFHMEYYYHPETDTIFIRER